MEFSLEKNGKGEKYGQENNALCRYRVIEISRIVGLNDEDIRFSGMARNV